jgi:N6-L-threonylcarbamoyladenine synthase
VSALARGRAAVILGIETSCDDTCAAVVGRDGAIRSNVIASQGLLHARYGGVVPEIASRHHLELVDAVTADALERAGARLDDVETVAVTSGPGLIGALLVGLSSAKAIAASRRLPLVPVDHLHGHVTASTLRSGAGGAGDAGGARGAGGAGGAAGARGAGAPASPIEPPYLCLVASGGHTFLARVDDPASYDVLGQTLDDAAGEAFDKGARLLGLGYPGGPEIDRLARQGDPEAFEFPRSAPGELDFSFSGLKTSLLYRLRDLGPNAPGGAAADGPDAPGGAATERADAPGEGRDRIRADLAASYQRAIVEALVGRTRKALERTGLERLAIGGGVAANSELRAAVAELGVPVWIPPIELCTDNAAMIAGAARFLEPLPYPEYLSLDAAARIS